MKTRRSRPKLVFPGLPEGEHKTADGTPRPPRPSTDSAPQAAATPAVEGERAPRKRRRRRHGRPVEGADSAIVAPAVANAPVQVPVKSMRNAGNANDSFLTRLGRKIRRMLSSD